MYIKKEKDQYIVKYGDGDHQSILDTVLCTTDRLETAVDLIRVLRGEPVKDDYFVRKALREYDSKLKKGKEENSPEKTA